MYTKTNIENIAGKYNNERIFVVGNGPSLNETPLEGLESEYSLAMNGIGSIYSERDWSPHFYYCALPPDHSGETPEDSVKRSVDLGIQCILNSGWQEVIGKKSNVYYLDRWSLHGSNPFANAGVNEIEKIPKEYLYEFWSDLPQYFVYHYHSMYSAIQTVISLGFDEIYLVGCDLGFSYMCPHMIFSSGMDPYRYEGNKYDYLNEAISKNKLFRSMINALAMKFLSYSDEFSIGKLFKNPVDNYFTKDYITSAIHDGEKAQAEQIKAHTAIHRICEDKNVDIYNATHGGELEVYQRVNISDVI